MILLTLSPMLSFAWIWAVELVELASWLENDAKAKKAPAANGR